MASYVYNWEEDFVRQAVYQGLLSMEPFLPRAWNLQAWGPAAVGLQTLRCKNRVGSCPHPHLIVLHFASNPSINILAV